MRRHNCLNLASYGQQLIALSTPSWYGSQTHTCWLHCLFLHTFGLWALYTISPFLSFKWLYPLLVLVYSVLVSTCTYMIIILVYIHCSIELSLVHKHPPTCMFIVHTYVCVLDLITITCPGMIANYLHDSFLNSWTIYLDACTYIHCIYYSRRIFQVIYLVNILPNYQITWTPRSSDKLLRQAKLLI